MLKFRGLGVFGTGVILSGNLHNKRMGFKRYGKVKGWEISREVTGVNKTPSGLSWSFGEKCIVLN